MIKKNQKKRYSHPVLFFEGNTHVLKKGLPQYKKNPQNILTTIYSHQKPVNKKNGYLLSETQEITIYIVQLIL